MSGSKRLGLFLAAAAAVGVFLVARAHLRGKDRGLGAEAGGEAAHAAGPKGAGADKPVPVLLAKAETKDVPITLEGLGTVTAYKTANVRPQVDGLLQKVIFREGQTVKKGEQLAQIDPRPFDIQLHQAEAALARDTGQLRGLERDLARYEAVVTKQLIPQQQVDDQRAQVEQLRGAVQGDEATIANAKLQLEYAKLKSPLDGVTGVRQVDPGNLVHTTDATGIVVVTQLDPIAVIFTLPQDDLGRVAAAQQNQQKNGPLVVEALARDGTQALATGQLEVIDNQINTATATIRIKAIFPNPARKLWPNQFVKTRLQLSVRRGALVVPAVAIQRGPQGTFVYVASGETAEPRPVTVDSIEGDQALVAKGIAAGDAVVIEGQNQLRPGAKIAVRGGAAAGGEGGGAGRPSRGSGHP
jgi:multidrug efflux system membrane fusion protein